MALWDSADLLRRCKLHARRPAVDAAMPDANWYDLLTEAQPEVQADLVTRYPDLAYGAPVLLTTADGGLTYTFGLDSAGVDAERPMAHTEIYPDLNSIPDDPLVPGRDYMTEGALIRMPSNRARLFSAGPYARFVIRADAAISAGAAPVIVPKTARLLLVWKALEMWAARPGSGVDPSYYAEKYNTLRQSVWTDLATAFNMAGAQGAGATGGRWLSLRQLAGGL